MASGSPLFKWLWLVLLLLVVDAAIEMALVSSMVYFLHHAGKGPFDVISTSSSAGGFFLFGEPANLQTNQGHTTNAAGGTIVVLLGFGGVLALWLERQSRKKHGTSTRLFTLWVVLTVLSALLTLGAFIYTYVVTYQSHHQTVDTTLARSLSPTTPYPRDSWTPETWYHAVHMLDLRDQSDMDLLRDKLRIMHGWRWNLIPMLVLGLVLASLAVTELRRVRRGRGSYAPAPTGPALPHDTTYSSSYGAPPKSHA